MDKKVLQEFATRVTQANPSELVVVIYEAAIASMKAVSYTHLTLPTN